jgi:hypothetical protein
VARRSRYKPLAGKCCTVPINALRPVGCSVDPEYEALMASKLIESNRNIFVEAALGQCCATSFGRQASDNHSASDAEHARFARESAATAIESRMYLLTDVCGTFEALTQRIQMYRDVADAKSSSPKHYVDDNDLIALAMYTQRSVYIVFYGNFNVRVICGDAVSAVPDVQQLSAVCFPDKAIVIEFIDHNSFPRPERDQIPS